MDNLDAPIIAKKFVKPKDLVKDSRKTTIAGMWAVALRLSMAVHWKEEKKKD